VSEGIRPDNPVRGVTRFADKRRVRRLSDDEYGALGMGLDLALSDGVNTTGIAAARLLVLTGWRMSDATNLRRTDIDAARRVALLRDTKSGDSSRALAKEALTLINAQPKTENPYVFPARVDDKPLQGLPRMWEAIRAKGGLPDDVTLHVLRHSFASLASDLGYSDAVIGALIGHKREGITARYTHAAEAVVLRAADEVTRVTLALMAGQSRDEATQTPATQVTPAAELEPT
jgi:integrase